MEAAMPLTTEPPVPGRELLRRRCAMRSPAFDRDLPSQDLVRVFDEDPDLLAGLDPSTTDLLRRRALTPKLWVEPGRWMPPDPHPPRTTFGLLVIEGLMIRSIHLDGRNCPELVGAGDLLRPWEDDHDADAISVTWKALERTSIAILDERFVSAVCRWPTIMSELLSRPLQRSRTLALHLAIAHVRHAQTRLRMLLWHLGGRWGRVTPAGVHLPLALTHETLADLACMRRPTASTALQRLCQAGELERRADGTWLLKGDPSRAA